MNKENIFFCEKKFRSKFDTTPAIPFIWGEAA